eukprot:COSAG02_NODE_121_length_35326_cov_25.450819_24_plen_51_part_00
MAYVLVRISHICKFCWTLLEPAGAVEEVPVNKGATNMQQLGFIQCQPLSV